MTEPASRTWDHVIVGGGASGAILAHRLSESGRRQVLLIEAGPDTPEADMPPEILDGYPGHAYLNPKLVWNDLRVTTGPLSHNRPDARPPLKPYEQGRVLGGSTSINGMVVNRGSPQDYADWVARGATGWGWDDVLPYFRKIEQDLDFDGPFHGKDGRLPVRRHFPNMWSEHSRAAGRALDAAGYRYLPDQNGEWVDGYYPIAIANRFEHRVSTAMAYLDQGTRARANLTILTGTRVTELIFDAERCVGVRLTGEGAPPQALGREIILSAGAIQSPAMLLRAGIGPAADLKALGISVRKDLPGVGTRLMEHPSVSIAAYIRPEARINGLTRRHISMGMRWSSGLEGTPPGDMSLLVLSKSAWHAVGDQLQTLVLTANRSLSEAGRVTLEGADWGVQPRVDFNLLHDRRDVDRLADAYRMFARISLSPELSAVISDPFPASYSKKVRQFGRVTYKNRMLTRIAAGLLDGPPALRRLVLQRFVMEGPTLNDLVDDPHALDDFIRSNVAGTWHASASCRMGAADDPMAVVDTQGRVRDVPGLRVVDASIFPMLPCANTSLPTMMVAEKIADMILTEQSAA